MLILQTGKGDANAVDLDNILLSRPMTLTISGEPDILDQMILVCNSHDMGCEVNREEDKLVSISFKNLSFDKRDKIMKQIQPMQRDAVLEWSK